MELPHVVNHSTCGFGLNGTVPVILNVAPTSGHFSDFIYWPGAALFRGVHGFRHIHFVKLLPRNVHGLVVVVIEFLIVSKCNCVLLPLSSFRPGIGPRHQCQGAYCHCTACIASAKMLSHVSAYPLVVIRGGDPCGSPWQALDVTLDGELW